MKIRRFLIVAVLTAVMIIPSFAAANVPENSTQDVVTADAAGNDEDQVDSSDLKDAVPYGEFVSNGDTGGFAYDDPSLTVSKKIGASALPAKYDLRDKGWVTSVKDQNNHNFCWAFATLASAESNLIKKGVAPVSLDLSEAHLGYFNFHGFNKYSSDKYCGKESFIDSGDEFSNFLCSAATLSRRFGIVTEKVMPYSKYNKSSFHSDSVRTKCQYLLKDMLFLETSQTTKSLDKTGMNNVKKMIMSNGAVASSVRSPGLPEYGVKKISDIRNYYSPSKQFDHGITIVGWDDNYPKGSFTTASKPAGNGAWLVKNSYGKIFGNNGYYWVSYYCPSVCMFCSFTAGKKDASQIYQYDGLGIGNSPLESRSLVMAANSFKARKDVLIDRVGTWTLSADSIVNVKVYVGKDDNTPTSGTKLINKTFKVSQAGYHTLDLGKNAGIPKGSKFSLIVKVKGKNGNYTAPFEICDLTEGDVHPAGLIKGQSYIKVKGKSWTDMKYLYNGNNATNLYNATIKGIGKNAGNKAQKIKAIKSKKVKKGKRFKIKAKRVKGNGKLVFGASNHKKAVVSAKGIVKAKKKGTVKITVRALPTKKYRSAKKVIKLKIK